VLLSGVTVVNPCDRLRFGEFQEMDGLRRW
jgi:hypothetical protein